MFVYLFNHVSGGMTDHVIGGMTDHVIFGANKAIHYKHYLKLCIFMM